MRSHRIRTRTEVPVEQDPHAPAVSTQAHLLEVYRPLNTMHLAPWEAIDPWLPRP